MIRAWRLVHVRHTAAAMTGDGARLHGGRWNGKGWAAIYTASSLSLAGLEIMAALKDYRALRDHYAAFMVHIPKRLVEKPDLALLPDDWTRPEHPAPKQLGDLWLQAENAAVLMVPSAVVPQESNYLINPRHPDFTAIEIDKPERFAFDPRLVKDADAGKPD